ncbi:hypothetical protein F2Q68_00004570 [Brassica cretica]|uniref:Uncharacterized protein n=2 Tax=Brassica cretica TaxID=69181 RepID=A0A3N6SX26_BRACR|nr:hypothetical protein F2Q68_00004570 [Brassica cretica]KAF3551726.1 hypothetical protein DY000_02006729 [Brassica cretica]
MSAFRAFTRSYMVVLSDCPLPGYEPTSYSKLNEELDTTVQLTKSNEENRVISNEGITPASGFQVPASRFRVPTPGSGSLPPGLGPFPWVWVPASSLRLLGRHVYNSTYWLRPLSPAHQQGPSTLTEAPRYIMLTAAY